MILKLGMFMDANICNVGNQKLNFKNIKVFLQIYECTQIKGFEKQLENEQL